MDEKITNEEILKRVLEAVKRYEAPEGETYTVHLRNKKFYEFD